MARNNRSFKKERFDALMQLADFRFQRWINRRQLEWKITWGFWAAILGATALIMQKDFPDLNFYTRIVLALIMIILVIVHSRLWVYWNWNRNQADISKAFTYVNTGEKIYFNIKDNKPSEKFWDSPGIFQIAISAALTVIFLVLLFKKYLLHKI